MLRLAVCIELIFNDRPFLERIDAVAEAGLSSFEFWGWGDKDIAGIIERKNRHGLTVANMNLDPLVCLPDGTGRAAFVRGVRESCVVAHRLGCTRLATPVDKVNWGPGEPWYVSLTSEQVRARRARQVKHVVATLKEAAHVAESEGMTLLIEMLNTTVDHAGYFVSSTPQGLEIVQQVDKPSVKLLFDVYHQQITEGNLISNLTTYVGHVGHIHVADVPGRHEPGTGEINFLNVLRAAAKAGYDGHVGLEYAPTGDHGSSMAAIRAIVDQVNVNTV